MTARSALHEATLLIARAKRRQSNKVSRSPQRPAGEPNTAAGGFLAFAGGTEARAKKTKEAAMRKRKERKRHDKLARYEQPAGRTALFYTLKNRHVIKMGWTAWRDFCRLTMTNTAFPAFVRSGSCFYHPKGWCFWMAVFSSSKPVCLYSSVLAALRCPAKTCTILTSWPCFNK